MSNTEKDRPRWVRENVEANRSGEHHMCNRASFGRTNRECDIDVPQTATEHTRCRHMLTEDKTHPAWYDRAPKKTRRIEYWKPERSSVRAELARALEDARVGVETGSSKLHEQHRHAPFVGGWWH